jgi:hypothetical protein
MMHGWGMGLFGLLVTLFLIGGILAFFKYIFKNKDEG